MNEPGTNLDTTRDSGLAAMQEEMQSLRAVVVTTLFALIILSGAVNIYLMRQARTVVAESENMQRMIVEYNTVKAPMAMDLWRKLTDYTRTHPDFKPIYDKYSPLIHVPPPGAKK
jgi:hypothetical protein